MQLIFISGTRAKARSITLGPVQWAIGLSAFLVAATMAGALLYYFTLSSGALDSVPFLKSLVLSHHEEEFQQNKKRVQENIDSMASRLGDLQAKLLEIDMMGKRLRSVVGMPEKVQAEETSPQEAGPLSLPSGGPLVMTALPGTEVELATMIEDLTAQIDRRASYLVDLEAHLTSESVRMQLFPGQTPINELYMTSGYGVRRDPFTGGGAMHTGVDFAAPVGTKILSAASGVVRYAEFHPQYGYMVDIDHGNGLMTRYAHCSELFVKAGEFIKRGGQIAAVGNTGRSTGPHLHFEVRQNDAPVNPLQFLRGNS